MSVELRRNLQEMDDLDFEQFVAALWSRQGWATKTTSRSNDRGIDVLAEVDFPYPRKIVLQAKRYSDDNTVGSRVVQQCAAHNLQYDVDEVVLVTTSTFTRGGVREAEDKNVKLVDIDTLCEIIRTANAYDIVNEYASGHTAQSDLEAETGIRLEDGRVALNDDLSGAENLRRFVRFLYENDYITEEDIPYSMGSRRFLLNTRPVHKDPSNEMVGEKEIAPNVWLETNLSNEQKLEMMERLSEEFLIF